MLSDPHFFGDLYTVKLIKLCAGLLLLVTTIEIAHAGGSTESSDVRHEEWAAYQARIAQEDANKEITRRWLSELWDGGDYAVAAELLTADFKRHSTELPATGPEAYAAIIKACHDGFPDTKITLVDLIAENDKVFVRWHWTGTHQADFLGVPATGKPIDVYGEDLIIFRDGKISEIFPLFDTLRVMLQIGAIEKVTFP